MGDHDPQGTMKDHDPWGTMTHSHGRLPPTASKNRASLTMTLLIAAVAPEGDRVVGGMDCQPHSQPWQVAILDMYKLYCGGVLVARQWVVTAAHCTTPGPNGGHDMSYTCPGHAVDSVCHTWAMTCPTHVLATPQTPCPMCGPRRVPPVSWPWCPTTCHGCALVSTSHSRAGPCPTRVLATSHVCPGHTTSRRTHGHIPTSHTWARLLVPYTSQPHRAPQVQWPHRGLQAPPMGHSHVAIATPPRVPACRRITSTHLGKHNLYTREWGEVQKMVQKFVPHPNYNPTTKDNDIMLMKLLTPVTLNNRIQPIPVASCLPEPGTTCVTSGWGATTSPEVTYPDVLQCVNVTIFSSAECHQLYPGSITDNMLCAGSLQGGRDSCQGDSGGPLVCNRTLQGIVSWGMEKCGQPKRPGVYTKVCRYAQWIQKTMEDNQ
ncbi:kallikrein-8-like [Strix aluco]|uniref:kallikrein-8-like n=1 Tax=Strix aluco TaxID=111821 RepID=UPI003DA524BE